jgi:hypothetical protein
MHFVIICAPRTGSSYLVGVLSGHPELFVNGNIFDTRKKRLPVFWPNEDLTSGATSELLELRGRDPESFLQRILSTNYGREHVGFKMFNGENNEILGRIVADQNFRKVVLYRHNVLANFSSALVAGKTGKYDLKEGEEMPATPKVRFDESKFERFEKRYTSFFRSVIERLNDSGQMFYYFDYEHIGEPRLIQNLVSFIGGNSTRSILKDKQYKRQVKQNPSNILSRFSNPKEVKSFLRDRSLLHWAHEGELSFEGGLASGCEVGTAGAVTSEIDDLSEYV